MSSELPMKVGRWALGDLAEDQAGRLWKVVGFITSPAVVFRPYDGTMVEEKVEVAGCRNEMNGLTRYARDPE
jgi:hypothetical protein